jgi:hypothetical protein
MNTTGTGIADDFFFGPGRLSPQMKGACNHSLPFVDHLSLAWSPASVEIYLAFLISGDLPTCEPYEYAGPKAYRLARGGISRGTEPKDS